MKILNEPLYPRAMINFMLDSLQKPRPDMLRVSELFDAPLVKHLLIKHWDDLTLDPEQHIPSLMGTAWHVAMEKYADRDHTTEDRLYREIGGVTITGQPDIVTPDSIEDHKTSPVFKYLIKDFDHWTKQLNTYRWLLQTNPKYLTIWAAFKDWSKMDWLRDTENYPRRRLMKISLPVWDLSATEVIIRGRIYAHQSPPVECTREEKWQTEDTYALKKEGRKSAIRVLDSPEAIQVYATQNNIDLNKKEYSIEHRKGECKRCQDWCPVSNFCPYWLAAQKEAA
jgi:hypothetical protein